MAYFGLVTTLNHVRKDENSDRLYLADCFGEGVIVGSDMFEGEYVLYLPTDGKIERWFGNAFNLFHKNEDGTPQGGYIEDNGHIRAIKLRGNQSSGVVISLARVYEVFGDQKWVPNGVTRVSEINGKEFCSKYIPKRQYAQSAGKKTSYKGRKAEGIVYPEFSMHSDTQQLAYNLDAFQPGDIVNMSLKMHGTSQRSMRTIAELPNGFFRRLFHMRKRTKPVYVCGTRRMVLKEDASGGYYGNDAFRLQHHQKIAPYVEDGMEVFYEVVGYVNESTFIMQPGDNKKINDKQFVKTYGPVTEFTYGCEPGQSEMYVYRITANNGAIEYTPEQMVEWCEKAGVHYVPQIETFEFTTVDDLQERINKYFEDLTDPVGKTHIKEGVVMRIVNRRTFTAFKSKTYEFRVLEGIVKESATAPDMEEAQEEDS